MCRRSKLRKTEELRVRSRGRRREKSEQIGVGAGQAHERQKRLSLSICPQDFRDGCVEAIFKELDCESVSKDLRCSLETRSEGFLWLLGWYYIWMWNHPMLAARHPRCICEKHGSQTTDRSRWKWSEDRRDPELRQGDPQKEQGPSSGTEFPRCLAKLLNRWKIRQFFLPTDNIPGPPQVLQPLWPP